MQWCIITIRNTSWLVSLFVVTGSSYLSIQRLLYLIFRTVISFCIRSTRNDFCALKMATTQDPTVQLDILKGFFTSHADRFQLIDGDIKSGSFGVCVRVKETFADGRPERSFILKRSKDGVDPGMDVEIQRLAVRFFDEPVSLTSYFTYRFDRRSKAVCTLYSRSL